MNRIIIPVLIIWMAVCTSQAQIRMSVQDCREMALANSHDIRISTLEYNKAVKDWQTARTAFLPELSGSATYAYLFKDMEMGMGMNISMKGMYMAGITIQQPIYAGGRIVNGNKMAKTGVAISEQNARLARINTLVEVEQAYWMYVSVNEKVRLLQQYTALLDTLLLHVNNLYEVQMATTQDIQQVRTRQSNIRYELQRAESGLELTRMSLCHLTGLDLHTPIIASDTVITVKKPNDPYSPAIDNRPELQMLQMQVRLKELEIKNTRAGFLPAIGLSAGYQHMGGMKFAGSSVKMNMPLVMASISIPIFHFGEGTKKIRSARIAHEISLAELNKNRSLMDIEAQQAHSAYQSAYLLIGTAEEGLIQAVENLRLVQNRYEMRMATIVDVMEAQTQWQEAYSNDIEARTNYRVKEVEYWKASGTESLK